MNRLRVAAGLILLLSLALCLSVITWLRGRQEMQAITAANEQVRKTLGEMTVALADKDREIDRLSGSSCDKTAKATSQTVAARQGKEHFQ